MTASPDTFLIAAAYPLLRLVNPADAFFALPLLGAAVLAAFVVARGGREHAAARARAVLSHPSTQLDLKLYVVSSVMQPLGYTVTVAGAALWSAGAQGLLARALGPAAASEPLPAWAAAAIMTVGQVLAIDLVYWLIHWAFHRVPALWALHRVHHSAEVMTPLTEFREHPLETILFANGLSAAVGLASGAGLWWLGPAAQPFTLLGVNAILLVHLATIHHLRHSHVWLPLRGWLGRLIHSPAHHQLHHSVDPAHYGRNLGYALSLFDWLFGTLAMPDRRADLTFGVPEGTVGHATVWQTLWRPVVEAARGRAASLDG